MQMEIESRLFRLYFSTNVTYLVSMEKEVGIGTVVIFIQPSASKHFLELLKDVAEEDARIP